MNNYITPYEYMQLNSKLIIVGSDYQRTLDASRVKRIVSNFNPDLVNPIKVNFRNGRYYCFDGQHTLASLIMNNAGNHLAVGCKVWRDKTAEWEAEMFSKQNGFVRCVETIAKLKALYISKDIDVLEFHAVTNNDAGVFMDFTKGHSYNKIVACSTAYEIFRTLGPSDYVVTLHILKDAYKGAPDSFSNQILRGVSQFHTKHKEQYNRALLVRKLAKISPIEIIREANLSRDKHRYYNQILRIYNNGLRTSRVEPK